jgi:hypothetical protein
MVVVRYYLFRASCLQFLRWLSPLYTTLLEAPLLRGRVSPTLRRNTLHTSSSWTVCLSYPRCDPPCPSRNPTISIFCSEIILRPLEGFGVFNDSRFPFLFLPHLFRFPNALTLFCSIRYSALQRLISYFLLFFGISAAYFCRLS